MEPSTRIDVNYELKKLSFSSPSGSEHASDRKECIAACGFLANISNSEVNEAKYAYIGLEPMRRPVAHANGCRENNLIWQVLLGNDDQANPSEDTVVVKLPEFIPRMLQPSLPTTVTVADRMPSPEPAVPKRASLTVEISSVGMESISSQTKPPNTAEDMSIASIGSEDSDTKSHMLFAVPDSSFSQDKLEKYISHIQGVELSQRQEAVNRLKDNAINFVKRSFIAESGTTSYDHAMDHMFWMIDSALNLACELYAIEKAHEFVGQEVT